MLLFLVSSALVTKGQSWEEAQASGKAELDIYWFTSVPFMLRDPDGNLSGMEYEMLELFQSFLRTTYQVDLTLNWNEAKSFIDILNRISTSENTMEIGISAFSITEERRELVNFTEPYLPDITVLVSSGGTPIVKSFEEISKMLRGMEAVTVEGTTYESLLHDLQDRLDYDFDILLIDSDKNILDYISRKDNRFGFIDLPIYLMLVRNGGDLTRQNLLTLRGTGYGFITPLNSDWTEAFNLFLSDPKSKNEIAGIISKYLGAELFEFIDNLYEADQLGTSILTKEKELQLALLNNANLKLQEEETFRRILISGIGVSLVFVIVIARLYLNNKKTTRLLIGQKNQIEDQQEDIRQKNEQLVNRNARLISLNEEKNNLMKILAHDLRSPLNQIIGFSDLLGSGDKKDDKELLSKIGEGAHRLSEMISKILDVKTLDDNESLVLNEQVNVDQIFKDIATRYRPIAEKKRIRLVVKNQNDRLIETDHLLLLLVLENLVSNAVKFSESDTKIDLSCEKDDEQILFKVKDQGPGFTEEDKKQAFKRFQKLSAKPTANEPSSGLGLWIVKKYVKDLRGKVWLESEEGSGATFFVQLAMKASIEDQS